MQNIPVHITGCGPLLLSQIHKALPEYGEYKKKKKYGSDAAALRKEKEASSLKANSASYKDDIDGA